MNNIVKLDENYEKWLVDLKSRYQNSVIKASVSVNREMLMFYWSLGRDIMSLQAESRYGSGFYDRLSKDLRDSIPNVKGFSPANLRYMKRYYCLYLPESNLPQVVEDSLETSSNMNSPQVVEDSGIFDIPWGHHRYIIDKCKDREKALFFVRKTLENSWSRAVLLNYLDTELFERQGKAISNFSSTLPQIKSDLAQEMTKDPYSFDFLTITEGYHEKELKDALLDNIQRFLLELGKGFAFVGREYRIVVGNTEQYIDMLFYNIRLHCYVVIEVKTGVFEPKDMGQTGTYVAIVDDYLKEEGDGETIGLLVCKNKDNVLAQYSVNSSSKPIGISEYELSNLIPEDFKGTLPSIEDIEKELS